MIAHYKLEGFAALRRLGVLFDGAMLAPQLQLRNKLHIIGENLHVIGMACEGLGIPKCAGCKVRQPRFADEVIGEAKPAAERMFTPA